MSLVCIPYGLDQLLADDAEREIYALCQASPLLVPHTEFLTLYGAACPLDTQEVHATLLDALRLDGLSALNNWMRTLPQMPLLRKQIQDEFERRTKSRLEADYQAKLDEIGRSLIFEYEGDDLEDYGYQRADFHVSETNEQGRKRHLCWLTLSRNIKRGDTIFNLEGWHGLMEGEAKHYVAYMLREADAHDWDAEKLLAWLRKLPQYEIYAPVKEGLYAPSV